MTKIPLTMGLVALIDDEDAERVMAFKWTAAASPARKGKCYAYRMQRDAAKKQRAILLHRFIMNAPSGLDVDHKDNDGLNCQKSNMRLATRSQNNQNMIPHGASGFKGVYLHSAHQRKKRFQAKIKIDQKDISLGYYATAEEAARAYDKKAAVLFGEFARLNFGGAR